MDVIEHIFLQTSSNEIKTVTPDRGKELVQTNGFQMNLTLHFIFLIRMRHGNEEQLKIRMA